MNSCICDQNYKLEEILYDLHYIFRKNIRAYPLPVFFNSVFISFYVLYLYADTKTIEI